MRLRSAEEGGQVCTPHGKPEVGEVTSRVTIRRARPVGAVGAVDAAGADARGAEATVDEAAPDSLEAAKNGDEQAFASLYCDLQPRLLRYATALVGQDAEDVTAEAWLQIARDIRSFSGDLDAFRGWTARIVRNRALDLARSRGRRPAAPAGLNELLDRADPRDTGEQASERMSTEQAVALIATLPRDQAEAVLLRVVLGLDPARAGQVVGKRAGAIRVASHRGLKALARRLDPEGQ